jgi:hypothetical protein
MALHKPCSIAAVAAKRNTFKYLRCVEAQVRAYLLATVGTKHARVNCGAGLRTREGSLVSGRRRWSNNLATLRKSVPRECHMLHVQIDRSRGNRMQSGGVHNVVGLHGRQRGLSGERLTSQHVDLRHCLINVLLKPPQGALRVSMRVVSSASASASLMRLRTTRARPWNEVICNGASTSVGAIIRKVGSYKMSKCIPLRCRPTLLLEPQHLHV